MELERAASFGFRKVVRTEDLEKIGRHGPIFPNTSGSESRATCAHLCEGTDELFMTANPSMPISSTLQHIMVVVRIVNNICFGFLRSERVCISLEKSNLTWDKRQVVFISFGIVLERLAGRLRQSMCIVKDAQYFVNRQSLSLEAMRLTG